MPNNVNIRQVAKAAGVSVATVSGILNSSGRLSPATAARVRQVMQELNYVPRRNRLRKKDPRGKSAIRRVGLLFPDVNRQAGETPLSRALAEGLQKFLAEQNIQVHVLTFLPDGSLPKEIVSGRLEGLVVRAGTTDVGGEERLNRALQKIGLPVIWTFGLSSSPLSDAVMVDDRGCGIWAADQVDLKNTGKAIMVLPAGNRNFDLEFRALAFNLQLQNRGFPSADIIRKSDRTLARALAAIGPKAGVTLFIPGHDEQVLAAREELARRRKAARTRDALIAVMVADKAVPARGGEVVQILHIDPRRIGMAAGQQLFWRLQNPWSETAHLLIPAKELQGVTSGNKGPRVSLLIKGKGKPEQT